MFLRLINHLYALCARNEPLLDYAIGVTELHDLCDGQFWPDWHCHVIVWGHQLITSESLNLWKFNGVHPHEHVLWLQPDSGGFPPLKAYQYLKKEPEAWEACFGNLTEEFLVEQDPKKGDKSDVSFLPFFSSIIAYVLVS